MHALNALHSAPCALHPIPCTLRPAPYIHPALYRERPRGTSSRTSRSHNSRPASTCGAPALWEYNPEGRGVGCRMTGVASPHTVMSSIRRTGVRTGLYHQMPRHSLDGGAYTAPGRASSNKRHSFSHFVPLSIPPPPSLPHTLTSALPIPRSLSMSPAPSPLLLLVVIQGYLAHKNLPPSPGPS